MSTVANQIAVFAIDSEEISTNLICVMKANDILNIQNSTLVLVKNKTIHKISKIFRKIHKL